MSKLIKKTIFDTDYYAPGSMVRVGDDEGFKNGLVLGCTEDQMTIAVARTATSQGKENEDERKMTVSNLIISVNEVEDGDYTIDKFKDQGSLNLQEIYVHYKELSDTLVEEESLVADMNGIEDKGDINERHERRLQDFQQILNKYAQLTD